MRLFASAPSSPPAEERTASEATGAGQSQYSMVLRPPRAGGTCRRTGTVRGRGGRFPASGSGASHPPAARSATLCPMTPTRVSLAALLLLLALAGGLGGWAWAGQGYPHTVYHARAVQLRAGVAGEFIYDEYYDPVGGAYRVDVSPDPPPPSCRPLDDGPVAYRHLPQQLAQVMGPGLRTLLPAGFRGEGRGWLGQAVGRPVRAHVLGRAALRFEIAPVGGLARETIWVDAATLDPLQVRCAVAGDAAYTVRLSPPRMLPPGTLPAGFFNPPSPQPGPWDRALGWLEDRAAGR